MDYDITHVEPRKGYKLFLRFTDGLEGEADVSHLNGKGVFKAWKKPGFFTEVRIDPESKTVYWPGQIDLAPDALHQAILAQLKRSRKAA